ncbi:unnamed protein product [Laminaria digitata]
MVIQLRPCMKMIAPPPPPRPDSDYSRFWFRFCFGPRDRFTFTFNPLRTAPTFLGAHFAVLNIKRNTDFIRDEDTLLGIRLGCFFAVVKGGRGRSHILPYFGASRRGMPFSHFLTGRGTSPLPASPPPPPPF